MSDPFSHTLFNSEKAFAFTPPTNINTEDLSSLPDDWVAQLWPNNSLIAAEFERHIGKYSVFSKKNELINKLQLIYYRLKGHFDDALGALSTSDRKAILFKLAEGLPYCTEGLYGRSIDIVSAFTRPQSLSELLYQVRLSLVKISAHRGSDDIHALNRFTILAEEIGLGVQAIFGSDKYRGDLSDGAIKEYLQTTFLEKYTPFNLPFLLAEQLHGLLSEMGYAGYKEDSYSVGPGGAVEKITDTIKAYLPTAAQKDWQAFFIIDEDCLIHDLNWPLIRKLFFLALIEKGYFTHPTSLNIDNLLDCARFSNLLPDNKLLGIEDNLITQCLVKRGYCQLRQVKENFPIYWEKLRCHPTFIKSIPVLIRKTEKTLHEVDFEGLASVAETFSFLFSTDLITPNLVDSIIKLLKKTDRNRSLLALMAHYHPSDVESVLAFITSHISQFDQKTLAQIVSASMGMGGNSFLLTTIRNHTSAAKASLGFISRHIEKLDPKSLAHMLLKKAYGGRNALMIAASSKPDITKVILDFMSEHSGRFDSKLLTQMFLATTKGGLNALMLAVHYQPGAISPILDFISQHREQFDSKILTQMFLATTKGGLNALMLAVHYQPGAISPILDFISQYPDLLDEKTLAQLFLPKNSTDINVLMLAAHHHPDMAKTILEFIAKHSERFASQTLAQLFSNGKTRLFVLENIAINSDEQAKQLMNKLLDSNAFSLTDVVNKHTDVVEATLNFMSEHNKQFASKFLTKMLLAKTNEDKNSLILTAGRQPRETNAILKFMSDNIDQFDSEILAQLFLEADNQGWNTLMLAVRHYPETISSILNFISQHIAYFSTQTLTQMFLGKTKNNWNTLMLAARNHPEATMTILNFLGQHIEQFDVGSLIQLFLESDSRGWHALKLAVYHQPDAARAILSFISSHISETDPILLMKLFVDKKVLLFALENLNLENPQEKILMDTLIAYRAHALLKQFSSDDFKSKVVNTPYILKKLLKKYQEQLDTRKESFIIDNVSNFFSLGRSTTEKRILLTDLINTIESNSNSIKQDLLNLQTKRAASNGRLGKLVQTCNQHSALFKPAPKSSRSDSDTGLQEELALTFQPTTSIPMAG